MLLSLYSITVQCIQMSHAQVTEMVGGVHAPELKVDMALKVGAGMYCTAVYYIILHCTVLRHSVPHCTIRHSPALHGSNVSPTR